MTLSFNVQYEIGCIINNCSRDGTYTSLTMYIVSLDIVACVDRSDNEGSLIQENSMAALLVSGSV